MIKKVFSWYTRTENIAISQYAIRYVICTLLNIFFFKVTFQETGCLFGFLDLIATVLHGAFNAKST